MTFETFLTADRTDPRTRRATTYALGLAIALHAAGLVLAIVQSTWRVDELSPPSTPVTLFTLPPQPPPPPAGSRQQTARSRPRPRPTATVQPRIQPVTMQEQPTADTPDVKRGDPTDGRGDPEGVIGGRGSGPGVGPARFVAPNVATGQLAINPQADAHRVFLPPALARAGMRLWALARVCVNHKGQVEMVNILRGADPTVDPLIVAALKTWRYRPYAIDGRPVPFCSNVRYEIAAQ